MAEAGDVPKLASMNHELIEDEGHRNPMTLPELEARLRVWLAGAYMATVFERDDLVVGYALWRDKRDVVSLRHFFVARACRRQGVGREAMRLLLDEVFAAGKRVRVEALVGNETALAFWRAAGFRDYAVTLELERAG